MGGLHPWLEYDMIFRKDCLQGGMDTLGAIGFNAMGCGMIWRGVNESEMALSCAGMWSEECDGWMD